MGLLGLSSLQCNFLGSIPIGARWWMPRRAPQMQSSSGEGLTASSPGSAAMDCGQSQRPLGITSAQQSPRQGAPLLGWRSSQLRTALNGQSCSLGDVSSLQLSLRSSSSACLLPSPSPGVHPKTLPTKALAL